MKIMIIFLSSTLISSAYVDFTEEEEEAIRELQEAGLMDVDIQKLLHEMYDEYYDNEYEVEYDYPSEDVASERGGPRRRKQPPTRKQHRHETRINLLQLLVAKLLGSPNRRKQVQHPFRSRLVGPVHVQDRLKVKRKRPLKREPVLVFKERVPDHSKESDQASSQQFAGTDSIITGLDDFAAPAPPSGISGVEYSTQKPRRRPGRRPSLRKKKKRRPYHKLKTNYQEQPTKTHTLRPLESSFKKRRPIQNHNRHKFKASKDSVTSSSSFYSDETQPFFDEQEDAPEIEASLSYPLGSHTNVSHISDEVYSTDSTSLSSQKSSSLSFSESIFRNTTPDVHSSTTSPTLYNRKKVEESYPSQSFENMDTGHFPAFPILPDLTPDFDRDAFDRFNHYQGSRGRRFQDSSGILQSPTRGKYHNANSSSSQTARVKNTTPAAKSTTSMSSPFTTMPKEISPTTEQSLYLPPVAENNITSLSSQSLSSAPVQTLSRKQTKGLYVGKPAVFTKAVGVPDVWDTISQEWGTRVS